VKADNNEFLKGNVGPNGWVAVNSLSNEALSMKGDDPW
jgi:hypothetical protein